MDERKQIDDELLDLDRLIDEELRKLKELIGNPGFKLMGSLKSICEQSIITSQPTPNQEPSSPTVSTSSEQIEVKRTTETFQNKSAYAKWCTLLMRPVSPYYNEDTV